MLFTQEDCNLTDQSSLIRRKRPAIEGGGPLPMQKLESLAYSLQNPDGSLAPMEEGRQQGGQV